MERKERMIVFSGWPQKTSNRVNTWLQERGDTVTIVDRQMTRGWFGRLHIAMWFTIKEDHVAKVRSYTS